MRLVCLVAVAAVLTACGTATPAPTPTSEPSAPPVERTTQPPAPTEPPVATNAPPVQPPPPASKQWAMPDLVGMVLQDAQDQIQAITDKNLLFTVSHDATGQKRNQLVDSNWKVCTQNVAPGTAITAETRIDFGAVKVTEQCP